MLGYHSQIILAGRRINDGMGRYVAENVVKSLIKAEKNIKGATVAILGFTFKENCPDVRNTRIIDIINELAEYGVNCIVCDPEADRADAHRIYGVDFISLDELKDMDAVVVGVAHDCFKSMTLADFDGMYKAGRKVMLDLKGVYCKEQFEAADYIYWRL